MTILRSIAGRLTWRAILIPEALALGVAGVQALVYWTPDHVWLRPAAYIAGWIGFTLTLVLAALVGDDACRRGVRPLLAYAKPFFASVIFSCLAFGVVWQLRPDWFDPRWPFSWLRVLANGADWAEFGGFGLAAYVNRQMATRILSTVRDGQLHRAQLERQLVASTLAATEAQMDPQLLIRSLTEICTGLERAEPAALQRLDVLIQGLRTTLTRTIAAEDPGVARL